MPFNIVRNDLTNMHADAIVNTANPQPTIGSGADSEVHRKAGRNLLRARKKIGDIPYGDAVITPAFDLNAKYVIHTAAPYWQGGNQNEISLLERCYTQCLLLAVKHHCKSIAFPLLSSGNQGFPKDIALQTAVGAFSQFLLKHDLLITLVVFDNQSFLLSEKLYQSVQSFIDDTYVREKSFEEYGDENIRRRHRFPPLAEKALLPEEPEIREDANTSFSSAPMAVPPRKLEDLMAEMEDSFSENLMRRIRQKGLKDPEVYKKANIDRKLFSKIKKNKDYKPSKTTAIAFALALELNLDETRDLIGRAGYAMTHSSKFDIIIEYFLLEQNYDIFEINEVLFAFDQPLIGV